MKRRDFFKSAAVVGLASIFKPGTLAASTTAASKISVQTGVDMVAVMGGEPEIMLIKAMKELGGIGKYVKKGQKVVIKPNIGWDKKPEMAANTNPELVGALIKLCKSAGAAEVLVFDHTCQDWQKCYTNSGIKAAVEKAGGKMVPGNDESYYREVQVPKGVQLKTAKIHKIKPRDPHKYWIYRIYPIIVL